MSYVCRAVLPAISILAALCLQAQQSSTPVRPEVETQPFVLSVITREVLVEVFATDRRGHPIRDLKQDEFQIFEVHGRSKTPVGGISKYRLADPAQEQGTPTAARLGVTVGGGCAERAAFHYEIAYHPGPEGWRSGYHEIEVRTTRHGVRLAYRDRYYAPETAPLANRPSANDAEEELWRAACYHSDFPPTLALRASQVNTADADVYRYFVTVDVDSLSELTIEGQSRRVQLDYGVCTFDMAGRGLRYMHASIDRPLSSSEYAQAVVHGFPNLLELPRVGGAAIERIALRDRATGNTGLINIPLASSLPDASVSSLPPSALTADEQKAAEAWERHIKNGSKTVNLYFPPLGPIGSFGTLQSRTAALCGDVYEVPQGTQRLPTFWNLSSIGSLYTEVLNVPHQQFWNTGGIPGITRRTDWFAIDYHGMIWITKPGRYRFELQVDDGARLYIDDELVIDFDGLHLYDSMKGDILLNEGSHSVRLQYMQGPQNSVGLVLLVKAPDDSAFTPFDMRRFALRGMKAIQLVREKGAEE
jgi:hypothetical protein